MKQISKETPADRIALSLVRSGRDSVILRKHGKRNFLRDMLEHPEMHNTPCNGNNWNPTDRFDFEMAYSLHEYLKDGGEDSGTLLEYLKDGGK